LTEFLIRNKDIPMMVESLGELFQEKGVMVKPVDLADRMSQKLNRQIKFHYASYLFSQLGFVTRISSGFKDRNSRYIIPDYELMEKMRR